MGSPSSLWEWQQEAQEFKLFMSESFTDSTLKEVESLTKNQANSENWHVIRFGRITASKLWEISRCKTPNGYFLYKYFNQ